MSEQRGEDQVDLVSRLLELVGIKSNIGYVYILHAENDLYKIGKTHNLKNRINTIRTASPVPIEVYTVFKAQDYSYSEQHLHEIFSEKRRIGEWFQLGEEELELIDTYFGNDSQYLRCAL